MLGTNCLAITIKLPLAGIVPRQFSAERGKLYAACSREGRAKQRRAGYAPGIFIKTRDGFLRTGEKKRGELNRGCNRANR